MVVMITSEEYKELVIKANKYDESQKPTMCACEEHKCDNDEDTSVEEKEFIVGKLEGEDAKKFKEFIEKIIKEEK